MYDPKEVERRVWKFWKDEKVYERVKKKNEKGGKYYFCDGPPYATGQIHPGTAWNKCIKDAMCRYRRARGFHVRAQPGFDTHGLPIEVKVEQELKLKSKKDIEKMGVPEFIKRCKEFAMQYIGVMGEQFQRLGVWMDWERPYITYRDAYIESSWGTLKKAHEKELLERGEYVLPFCPRCETSVANYELEYDDRDDPSIYVKFKIAPERGKNDNEYLVIWTTTPWTLVANMGVMVHPDYQYVKVKVDDEFWIVAKERLDAVMKAAGDKHAVVVDEFSGRKLENVGYEQPLREKVPRHKDRKPVVMSAEFVTLEDGTGLVHTAPGHGPQDFIVGKRYGIEAFCPVDRTGHYTGEAGAYKGIYVKDADKIIMKDLKDWGTLIRADTIRHRYPHCWRCKTPLIFITTDQWFIMITRLKDRMFEEIDKTKWQPDFARTWFRDFVSSAPDWCISRQRYWGIPLPIWVCEREKCGSMKVVGSREELGAKGKTIPELHIPYVDTVTFECKCGGTMRRVPDVLDVWFDSGNAIWASLEKGEENWYPCDFIVEGKDQIRGWFYSLLGSGLVLNDEIPYKNLLMHGHFVDEKGEKMSKSLGNFVPLEEIVDKYGADAFRLWSLSSTIWDDLKFNWDDVKEAGKCISILWNLHVLALKFADFDAGRKVDYELEDEWLLLKLNELVDEATKNFDEYEVHSAVRAIREFVVEDLSRFYVKLAKKRIADGRNADGARSAISKSLFAVVRLLAPITPFIAEEIYQRAYRKKYDEASVSLLGWPASEKRTVDPMLKMEMSVVQEIVRALANARQKADVKLRWPLEEAVLVLKKGEKTGEVETAVEKLSYIIEWSANVKKIKIAVGMQKKIEARPVFGALGPAFKKDANKIGEAIKKLDGEKAKAKMERNNVIEIEVEGTKFPITKEMVEFVEKDIEGYARAEFPDGEVYLNTKISDALYSEAMAREVARRAQMMRKEMGLVESDTIRLNVVAGKKFLAILHGMSETIKRETKAKELTLSEKASFEGKKKSWDIEGEKVELVIAKLA